jgi:hypothetical protein
VIPGDDVRVVAAGLLRRAGADPRRAARAVAVGWATVELERAAPAFAAAIPGGVVFEAAADEPLLGARCWVAAGTDPAIALLEPSTEARVAAFLARHGEGPAAVWLAADDGMPAPAGTRVAEGPFGPEHLESGGPDGPYVLVLVGRASTIRA